MAKVLWTEKRYVNWVWVYMGMYMAVREVLCECAKDIESMGLLGDQSVELFLGDNAVEVKIGTLDHFLKDIIVSEFSKILGNLAEVLKGNES